MSDPIRPIDAFITVIGLCTNLGQVKTMVELIDILFREHTIDFLLNKDDWPKLTKAVVEARQRLPEKERLQDRIMCRYHRLQNELYWNGKIPIGEATVSMTVEGQRPTITEFNAAIDKLLELDQRMYGTNI